MALKALLGGPRWRGGTLERWLTDEPRVGLPALLRRVWAWPGQRPSVPLWPRYAGLYSAAFAQPASRRAGCLRLPGIERVALNLARPEGADFV